MFSLFDLILAAIVTLLTATVIAEVLVMTLNKTILAKAVKQSQKVQKELEKLRVILEPVNDAYFAIDPSSFYIMTDLIPEIKAIMGGEIRTYKSFLHEGTFEAELMVDGVKFVTYTVPDEEKWRYE